ncbi:MAG TPA: threonine synthase [Vicinamibacterales bacterium]
MRFVSTARPRGDAARSVSLKTALFEGLAADGHLYVPESIDPWSADDLEALRAQSLIETSVSVLRPFVADDIPSRTLSAIVDRALTFPILLEQVEPRLFALELFHGPTLAFKDVGARVLAGLMAALHDDPAPLTVLAATSGDTGSAVGHAFQGVDGIRVVILYPDGRVSPTQEAQLTMFNHLERSNVRAYAVAGVFDDCQRLVKSAFADASLRRKVRLTSANSINIGRLLPQMIYYFHAAGRLDGAGPDGSRGVSRATRSAVARGFSRAIFSVPSGNFGNLAAGLMARRAGAPIDGFIAATNANDIVPQYLRTGRFEPRASIATIANAMDCGNPSNFDRLQWLYGGEVDAMRRDVEGSVHTEDEVRATIRRVYEERNYLLDPHSAIAYLGARSALTRSGQSGAAAGSATTAVFLATAHPAKFAEVVEPIIGEAVAIPEPLAAALAAPRSILRLAPALDALRETLSE